MEKGRTGSDERAVIRGRQHQGSSLIHDTREKQAARVSQGMWSQPLTPQCSHQECRGRSLREDTGSTGTGRGGVDIPTRGSTWEQHSLHPGVAGGSRFQGLALPQPLTQAN